MTIRTCLNRAINTHALHPPSCVMHPQVDLCSNKIVGYIRYCIDTTFSYAMDLVVHLLYACMMNEDVRMEEEEEEEERARYRRNNGCTFLPHKRDQISYVGLEKANSVLYILGNHS